MIETESNKKKKNKSTQTQCLFFSKNNRCSYLEVIVVTSYDKSIKKEKQGESEICRFNEEYKQERNRREYP